MQLMSNYFLVLFSKSFSFKCRLHWHVQIPVTKGMYGWTGTRENRQSINIEVKIFWKATCSAEGLFRSCCNNTAVFNRLSRIFSRKPICLGFLLQSTLHSHKHPCQWDTAAGLFTLRNKLFRRSPVEKGEVKKNIPFTSLFKNTGTCVCLGVFNFHVQCVS